MYVYMCVGVCMCVHVYTVEFSITTVMEKQAANAWAMAKSGIKVCMYLDVFVCMCEFVYVCVNV
jgi:hypothetical protein